MTKRTTKKVAGLGTGQLRAVRGGIDGLITSVGGGGMGPITLSEPMTTPIVPGSGPSSSPR